MCNGHLMTMATVIKAEVSFSLLWSLLSKLTYNYARIKMLGVMVQQADQ